MLEAPIEWSNSTLIGDNVAEAISRVVQQADGGILLLANAEFIRTLMEHDLIDRYRLGIIAAVAGSGKRLFADVCGTKTMRFVETTTFGSGVVSLIYRPAANDQQIAREDDMKLLLTSIGVTNESIRKALVELLGKPVEECRATQISTALYASPSGPEDAYQMVKHYGEMGWKELGTLELTALPTIEEEHWLPFVESSDAILVSGGNTGYLSYWFQQSRFAERLPALLEKGVYVGISAGSALVTPGLNYDRVRFEKTGVYYDDEYEEAAPHNAGSAWAMGLVGFAFRPHLDADYFPTANMGMMERAAAKLDYPLYAIDDETAIKVVDGEVEVVSEGEWRLFDTPDQ